MSIPNPHNILLPGMSAFVRIQTPEHALVVPRLAVLNPFHGPVTFVVRNHYAYLQPVQINALIGDHLLIQHGLKDGDRVLLVGQDTLRDGLREHIRSIEV